MSVHKLDRAMELPPACSTASSKIYDELLKSMHESCPWNHKGSSAAMEMRGHCLWRYYISHLNQQCGGSRCGSRKVSG